MDLCDWVLKDIFRHCYVIEEKNPYSVFNSKNGTSVLAFESLEPINSEEFSAKAFTNTTQMYNSVISLEIIPLRN